jgi:O-phospho-L-seryl-tRNASec:L-selenocysteinyl-tRNA synthase
VDLFITLLSMGLKGYQQLLQDRRELVAAFSSQLRATAEKHGERLLLSPENSISFAMTLDNVVRVKSDSETASEYLRSISNLVSKFGAMLFSRCVSGTRVVPRGESKVMSGEEFKCFGSSFEDYPHAYMTAACAIGVSHFEVDEFFTRLDKALQQYKKR